MAEITFNSFPSTWYVPGTYTEVNPSRANKGLAGLPKRHIIFGQKLAAGTADANVPIMISTPDDAAVLSGRGSMLHQQVIAARAADSVTDITIVPLDDNGAGTKSTRPVMIAGPATAAGTLVIYVGGRRYSVGVANAATATTVAAAIVAAIQADSLRLCDAAVDGEDDTIVNLTARHKGADAGNISCTINRYAGERLPAGITVTIGALTAGTGNPDVTTAIAALGDVWYTQWTLSFTDGANLALYEAELASRYEPLRMLEAVAFTAVQISDVAATNAVHTGRNSPHVAIIDSADTLTPAFVVAAACGGANSAESDPGRPRDELGLPGIVGIGEGAGRRKKSPDQQSLLATGISTLYIDAGGVVRIQRITMCYRTNAQGQPDDSYFDLESMELIRMLRYTYRATMSSKYSRWKLGQDGSEGDNVMTPSTALSEGVVIYKMWMKKAWVEGGVAFTQFKADQRAEIDADDPNRLNHLMPPDLINQLRVTAMSLQFIR